MSKVVFVGNVPYNMGEEQLIDVFKSVGQVIGFRLVFDRDTGKPKGYGFCEFADHETANSAVRNLNGYEVGGRPLRIDLADSDPFLEGKTTVRGELVDSGSRDGGNRDPNAFLNNLPHGKALDPGLTAMDMISNTLASMPQRDLMDVLAHMKAFVITHPDQARALLVAHPQLAYALFQALLLNRIVDESILTRMLNATGAVPAPATGPSSRAGNGGPPPPQYQQPPPPSAYPYPPPPNMMPPYMAGMPPPPFPPHMQPYFRPPPPPIGMMGTPPSGAASQPSGSAPSPVIPTMKPAAPMPTPPPSQNPPSQDPLAAAGVSEQHKTMLMQVLQMTPEQIAALPDNEKAAIQQLRAQFSSLLGGGGVAG
ncbi:hypothetical protein Moror_16189 [Moniliophthora roreri MCA 2997]|uniref:RRM domain-containing protein n=2 Tax=Moniliophthora roreri TaxID=221103 RepID=V2YCJ3_MONRO|nr:hypothetical protein Moror_16189 [Moniliophthora roreri MCA 2997]